MRLISKGGKRKVAASQVDRAPVNVESASQPSTTAVDVKPKPKQQPQPQLIPQQERQPVQPQPIQQQAREPVQPQTIQQQPQPQTIQQQPQLQTIQQQPLPASSYLTQYPDVQLSETQQLALHKAAGKKDVKVKRSIKDDEYSAYNHLAPPKKSPIKIILKVFLLFVLIGAAGLGGLYYWWTHYAKFEYELQPIVILNGQQVSSNDFLPSTEISKGITAYFQNPEFTPVPGRITVPLILELGLRALEANATLCVLTSIQDVTHEFKEESPAIDPKDMLSNSELAMGIPFDVHFTEEPLPLHEYEVGEYTLKLSLNDTPFEVPLIIVDTTAPIAETKSVVIRIGEHEEITADDFITQVFEHSPYSVAFVDEPNWKQREQIVEIIIEDIYGNSNIYATSLTIIFNEHPPTLEGIPDVIESMVGNAIIYLAGVTAYDDFDRDLTDEIRVDSSDVNQNEIGEYTITYSVEDFSGNITTSHVVSVFIIEIDPEFVNDWVDEKLEAIITDEMNQEQQARAILEEVRRTLRYINEGDGVSRQYDGSWSVYEAAYRGIRNRGGNCYNYYALSEVMLTRAGIPNMRIERVPDRTRFMTRHFWSLINPDEKGWYHFDAAGFVSSRPDINAIRHMFTQEEAEMIDNVMSAADSYGGRGYYEYDKSKFQAMGIEIVQKRPS